MRCKIDYNDKMKQRWEGMFGEEVEGVEEEWNGFKEAILEVTGEVFEMIRIRKGTQEGEVNGGMKRLERKLKIWSSVPWDGGGKEVKRIWRNIGERKKGIVKRMLAEAKKINK